MNKKSLIKISTAGLITIFAVFVIISLMLIFSSNALTNLKEKYYLGETVILDLNKYSNYSLKIITPSTNYLKEGNKENLIFDPTEIGNYSIIIISKNSSENFNFEVINDSINKINESLISSLNSTNNNLNKEDKVIENLSSLNNKIEENKTNPKINEEYKWKQKIYTNNKEKLKLRVPKIGKNLSIYLKNKKINYKEEKSLWNNIKELFINDINKNIILENVSGEIEIEYTTEGPKKQEENISDNNKIVTVYSPDELDYKNVSAYTKIAPLTKDKDSIKVFWKQENKSMDFDVSRDENGYINKIEWIVPHLSNQTFDIIIVTKAEHLNKNKEVISNIFEKINELDNFWSEEINDSEYIRLNFEIPLDSTRDISFYPKIISGNPKIEVYIKGTETKVAEYSNIKENEYNKILLSNLNSSQDSFDLKIIGGSIIFDHIIDPVASFLDGSATGTIGTTAATNNSLGNVVSTIESTNIILASVQVMSTDGGNENVVANALNLYGYSGLLSTNEYNIQVGGSNSNANYFLMGVDYNAPAGTSYNITAYADNTQVNTEAKIIVLSGIENFAYNDSISKAFSTTEVPIATVPTNFSAGNNVIIASIQIDNSGTAQDIAAGNIKIKNGNTLLSSNQYNINLDTSAPTDKQYLVLLAYDSGASANSIYNITITGAQSGNAEAKVMAFRVADAAFLDSGSTNIGTTATMLGNLSTTFSAGSDIVSIAAGQVDDTDSNTETLAAGTGLILRESNVNKSSNELIMAALGANDNVGDGFRHTLLFRNSSSPANPSYSVIARANAAGLRGEFKILALQISAPDTTSPQVTIAYPSNNNYSSNISELNYTLTETNPAFCWRSNSSGIWNSTKIKAGNNFTNVTSIEGWNNWTLYCNDTRGNTGNITVEFYKDSIYPVINIANPQNATNTSNKNLVINYTYTEANPGSCYWTNDTGINNYTLSNCNTNISGQTWPEGNNILFIYMNDTFGHTNYSQVSFSVDTINPDLNLFYPLNTTYNSNVSRINYTYSDTHSGSCWYSNNSGIWNSTTNPATNNYTNATSVEGNNIWKLYCNDSAGNLNSTNVTFFKDTIFPGISFGYNVLSNATNISQNFIYVNVTINEINFANITFLLYNSSGLVNSTYYTMEIYEINWSNLANGVYYYNITITDTLNNINSTETRKITLDTILPSANLSLPENNSYKNTISLNFSVNISDNLGIKNASLSIYNSTSGLLINSTNTTLSSGTFTKTLGIVVTLSDGIYKWLYGIFDWSGNSVYTSNYTVTIDTVNPRLNITYPANTTYGAGLTIMNYTYLDNYPSYCWYTNSSGIWNSSIFSAVQNFTSINPSEGSNNFTIYCNDSSGNRNSSSISFSIDTIAPIINFTFPSPGNGAFTNNRTIVMNVSIREGNLNSVTYGWNVTNYTIYNNSLLLMYSFENLSSLGENDSKIVDSSRNGNNGTMIGGSIFNLTGKYGKSLQLSGTNYINTSYVQTSVTQYTIATWLKTTSSQGVIVQDRGSGAGLSLTFAIHPSCGGAGCTGSSAGIPSMGVDSAGVWIGENANQRIDDGNWHYVVGVFESTAGQTVTASNFKIYIDGVYSNGNDGNQAGTPTSPLTGLDGTKIGRHDAWNQYYTGQLDELRIWNRSLSADEVQEQYMINLQKYNSSQWFLYINQTQNTTTVINDGLYYYFISARDNFNNENAIGVRNITIDTIFPEINITYPLYNTTYYTNISTIVYDYYDENAGRCWYSNNSGIWNSTSRTAGQSITNAISIDGINNWTVYCNDSAGNINFSEISFYKNSTVFAVEILSPLTGLYNYNITELNYTARSPQGVDQCWYSNNSGIWNSTIQPYSVGSFQGINSVEGINNWTVYCNESTGNITFTKVGFLVDSISPNATLLTPINGTLTNTMKNLSVNVTDNYRLKNATLYVYNSSGDIINQTTTTISGTTKLVGIIYSFLYDGIFKWLYEIRDTTNNFFITENNTITIHTILPVVNITYPQNILYATDVTELNYTYFDDYPGYCWYSFDSGITNSTPQDPGLNWFGLTSNEGFNIWTLYCNDTYGNIKTTTASFIKDSSPTPLLNFTLPTFSTGAVTSNTRIPINVSIIETNLNEIKYNWNGTNFTMYNNSLLLMYNFENLSLLGENQTRVTDLSIGSNNGTIIGTATYNLSGKYGKSVQFDGSSGYINTSYVQRSVTAYTIAVWVKTSDSGAMKTFVQDRGSGAGMSLTLGIGATGGGHGGAGLVGFELDSNGIDIGASSTQAINDNNWHYVVGVWNASSGTAIAANQFRIYIDGVSAAVTTGSTGSASSPLTGLDGTKIGRHDAWNTYFNGQLDELRIWNRSLSSSEIYEQYISNLQKFNPSQWYLYLNQSKNSTNNLDDGVYTYFINAVDNSGNSNRTEIRNITIDTILPVINITFPNNNTLYNYNITIINYTYSDSNPASCWYSNSSGIWNSSKVSALSYYINASSKDNSNIWTLYCNDSAGNTNSTTINFTRDILSPFGNLLTPPNNSYNNSINQNFTINASDQAGLRNATLSIYNTTSGLLINQTSRIISGTQTLLGIIVTLTDGIYKWFYSITDSGNNNYITNNYTVTIDTVNPRLNITYPSNTSYLIRINTLNYSYSDNNNGRCWYTNSSGIWNSTPSVAAGNNFTGVNTQEGINIYTIYCNDSAGNMNSSSVNFTIDSLYPQINYTNPTIANGGATKNSTILINVSIFNRNVSEIQYSFNQTNFTIYNDSLILMYNFDNVSEFLESSISNFTYDASKNSYSGNCSGMGAGCNYTTGKYQNALSLDGVNDYVNVPYSFSQPNKITIATWFKTSSNGIIFGQHDTVFPPTSPSSYIPTLWVIPNGSMRMELWTGGLGAVYSNNVADNNWHYAVAVGDTNMQYLYIDGVLVGSRSGTLSQSWWTRSTIGTGYANSREGYGAVWRYFNGSIDEFRIWNRALSSEEINEQYMLNLQKFNSTLWYININQSKNSTNTLDDGIYNFITYAKDTLNRSNSSERNITIDRVNPDVNIRYPLNTSYGSNVSRINYTYSDFTSGSCWYSNNSGIWNSTIKQAGQNFTLVTSVEGSNTWTVYCNDSAGNMNSSSVTFYKNSTLLSITIVYPESISYNYDITNLSYSYTGADPESCWWSNSSGLWNSTIVPAGNNWTGLTSKNGTNTWTVYCNTTLGVIVNDTIAFVKDLLLPNATLLNPGNNTYSPASTNFSVNITDNIALSNTTLYILNASNDLINSTSFAISGVRSVVGIVVTLVDGVYNWFYEVVDVANNHFFTENNTVIIHGSIPNLVMVYPLNTTYTTNVSEINYSYFDELQGYCWYTNSSGIWNSSSRPAGTNFTNVITSEGSNTFTLYCNDSAGNINSSTVSFFVNYLPPILNFTSPTLSSGTYTNNRSIRINVSIYESLLSEFKFNWNGTNYTLYNETTRLMYNLDNNSNFLENSSSNLVYDASNYSYNGICSGMGTGCNWTTGKYGKALRFDGVNDYVNIPSSFGQPSTITISLWFKTSSNGIIFGQHTNVLPEGSPGSYIPTLWVIPNGSLRMELWTGGLGAIYSNNVSDNNWHQAVIVGNTNIQYLYVDGVLIGSRVGAISQAWWTNTTLGTGYANTREGYGAVWRYFNGSIDEVNIYNRAMDSSEIYELYISNLQKISSSTWYFSINQSLNSSTGLNDGLYTFSAYGRDRSGTSGVTETRNVTVDTINPSVNITYPRNNTVYTTNVSELNYTYNDTNPGNCWYTNSSGIWNSTGRIAGENFTNVNTKEGNNFFIIYCNDSAGNINSSSVYFIKDSLGPNGNLISPQNNTYTRNTSLNFTVNASDSYNLSTEKLLIYNSSNDKINETSLFVTGTQAMVGIVVTITDGIYNWLYQIIDSSGNSFYTNNYTLTIDTIIPEVRIIYPILDENYTSNISTINYTYSDTNPGRCYYSNNSGIWNSTPSVVAGNNFTLVHTEEGYNTFTVYCNDSAGNINSSTVTFFKDSFRPRINITSPINGSSFGYDITELNYTIIETNPAYCWYSNDSGITNSTIRTAGENFTGLSSIEGTNNWTIYCNDTYGNYNSNTTTFLKDTIPPTANLVSPTNNTPTKNLTQNLTVNATDNVRLANVTLFVYNSSGNLINQTNKSLSGNQSLTGIIFNFSSDGIYTWSYLVVDTLNHQVYTENYTIEISTMIPDVKIIYPENIIYTIDVNELNYTFISARPGYCWYSNNSGVWNSSIKPAGENFTNMFSLEGNNTWIIYCNDSYGNSNSSNVSFIKDTIFPSFNITYPLSRNYSINISTINYSYFDTNPGYCWYSNNSGIWNSSKQSAGTNFTNINSEEGLNNYTLYCNDSAGHENSSSIAFFKDTIYPLISFGEGTEINASNFSRNYIYVNVSIIELNEINITFSLHNLTRYVNITTMGPGNYTINWTNLNNGIYYYNVTITDRSNNINFTETRKITLDTIAPNGNLTYPENNSYKNNLTQNFTVNATDNLGLISATLNIFNSSETLINQTTVAISGTQSLVGIVVSLTDGVYKWFYSLVDFTGNTYNTFNNTVTIDTNYPLINIVYPINNENYTINVSEINYTISEEYASRCYYSNNSGIWNSTPSIVAGNNFTNVRTIEGINTLTVYCNDSAGNINSSTVTFFKDSINPQINITYPINNRVYNVNISELNYTYNDTNPGYCWYSNNSGIWNSSYVNASNNQINISTIEGNNSITLYCNDSLGNQNKSNITFFKDTIFPQISFGMGTTEDNLTIYQNYIYVNVTVNEANEINITFTLFNSSGLVNSTISTSSRRTINWTNLSTGVYYFNVSITDIANNINTTETRIFNYSLPDFLINSSSLSIIPSSVKEGDQYNLTAVINNLGGVNISNVTIRFYNGDPSLGGTQTGTDRYLSFEKYNSNSTYITLNSSISLNNIFVVVDPNYSSNGTYIELNETNNKANISFTVDSWSYFYGNILNSSLYTLTGQNSSDVESWLANTINTGNIYITTYGASVSWQDLEAIGKNKFKADSFIDFSNMDLLLGSSNYSDSINNTFTSSGLPKATETFNVFKKTIENVPTVNSTNNSNFITGILWDTKDDLDNTFGSPDNEDIIFVTKINKSNQGYYGTYDYELKVPAKLRNYKSVNSQPAIFYAELN